MFIPRKFGGLGVINPTTTYIAKTISFLLSTLNSDDPQTRHSARSSLELHRKKRRVDKNNTDSSFAGYCTNENGRLVKQCAVNWPVNRFGSSSMNCACAKAIGWRCLAMSMCISPLLITRLLLFCAINLLRLIISKASI